jgi:hypothetical protein
MTLYEIRSGYLIQSLGCTATDAGIAVTQSENKQICRLALNEFGGSELHYVRLGDMRIPAQQTIVTILR